MDFSVLVVERTCPAESVPDGAEAEAWLPGPDRLDKGRNSALRQPSSRASLQSRIFIITPAVSIRKSRWFTILHMLTL